MKRLPRYGPGAVLAFAVLLLLGSFSMMAGCADEAQHHPLASGKASYEAYCLGCHGPNGKGNGDIVGDLELLPTDLTQLSSLYDGAFPLEMVYQSIDGRKMIEAHGTREMPVWGNIWSERDGQPIEEERVERRINELVEYIRSIQDHS